MSHIEKDLLAYLDGELSPTEAQAVEVHTARCQSCRLALDELRALRSGLTTVVPAAYQSVTMPAAAEARIRSALAAERTRQGRGGLGLRLGGLVAGLSALARPLGKVAVPLVALFFVVVSFAAAGLPQQTAVHETVVLGQDTLIPGTEAALRVLVRDGESSRPIADAPVRVTLRQAGLAREVYTGRTDGTGTAPVRFAVPDDWRGDAELVVESSSDLGSNRVSEPIQLQRAYRLLLGSDKPVYRPGETLYLRTLALGTVDGLPAAEEVTRFEVVDPAGSALLAEEVANSDFGIAATDLALADDATQGQYQLRATLGDTTSELSVQVSDAPLPSFRVDVTADRPFVRPGDTIGGRVNAAYFFGRPLESGQVELRLVGYPFPEDLDSPQAEPLFSLEQGGPLGPDGTFSYRFQAPPLPEEAYAPDGTVALAVEAAVTDPRGERQFGWLTTPMALQPILVDVVAEGGTLRSGVENILYVFSSYPDGRPAPAAVEVQIGNGAPIATETTEFGLAEVRFVPRAGDEAVRNVRVAATDGEGRSGSARVVLPLDEARDALLLRTDRAFYRVGDTLAVEALATATQNAVYLDVIKGGQTVLTQSALPEDGQATFALDLTPELAGTLELYAYQVGGEGSPLRDTRVVLVEEAAGLDVQLATDRAQYRPGEVADVTVQVEADGEGVEAAVGVAAVNEAVYAQREYQPGFARLYFLLDETAQAAGVSAATPSQVDAVDAAQQQAALAAWSGYRGRDFTLAAQESDLATRSEVNQERQDAFQDIGLGLAIALAVVPLLLAAIVLAGLRRSGVLGPAVSRGLATLVVLAVVAAALLASGQLLASLLGTRWSTLLLAILALLWLLGLAALFLFGWRRRDQRAQYVALLLATYAACLLLIAFAADQGANLSSPWPALLAIGFALLLAGVVFFGWGLRLEGERTAGILTLVLAALILPLAVALTARGDGGAQLVREITRPTLVGLQGGLLAACVAPAPMAMPEAAGEPAAAEPAEAQPPMFQRAAVPQTAAEAPAEAESTLMPPEEQPLVETMVETVVVEREAAAVETVIVEATAIAAEEPAEGAALSDMTAAPEAGPPPAEEAVEEVAAQAAEEMAPSAAEETAEWAMADTGPAAGEERASVFATETVTMTTALAEALSAMKPLTTPTTMPTEEAALLVAPEPAAITETFTPLPTDTPTPLPTDTPTPLPTDTPTQRPTPTPTPLPTDTPTSSPTDTPTPRPTETPTPLPTDVPTALPTDTPKPMPAATPEPREASQATAVATAVLVPPTEAAAAAALPETPTPAPLPTATPPPAPAPAPEAAPATGLGGGGDGPAQPTPLPPEALPIIRSRFPQTLYWNPEVITDPDGRLRVGIPTGDSITTWRLTALAVSRDGRLGSATAPLVVFQPLFVELHAPATLAFGETATVPVRLFNYTAQPLDVTLDAEATPGLRIDLGLPTGALRVPANEFIELPMTFQAIADGEQTVVVLVTGGGIQDARQATITVIGRG